MMGFEGATWLERKERAKKERPNLLIGDLHLKRGMTIADIGAGSGYYSRRMAPLIAPGKVLAVEIQPEMVDLLRKLAAKPGLGNIVPILGSQENVNLAEGSVDLAVMVDVYHEVSFPHEVISSIISALKPKGRLVFVEYRGEDPAVQISPVHKMTVKQILLEMDQFPLVLERRDERLPLQHIVIFRRQ